MELPIGYVSYTLTTQICCTNWMVNFGHHFQCHSISEISSWQQSLWSWTINCWYLYLRQKLTNLKYKLHKCTKDSFSVTLSMLHIEAECYPRQVIMVLNEEVTTKVNSQVVGNDFPVTAGRITRLHIQLLFCGKFSHILCLNGINFSLKNWHEIWAC